MAILDILDNIYILKDPSKLRVNSYFHSKDNKDFIYDSSACILLNKWLINIILESKATKEMQLSDITHYISVEENNTSHLCSIKSLPVIKIQNNRRDYLKFVPWKSRAVSSIFFFTSEMWCMIGCHELFRISTRLICDVGQKLVEPQTSVGQDA